ncbi:hypothetical protein S7711_00244 [Stachybotrys chartarum IBT 7711]|uniref:T6SS Phospholipase effector Tle1-like catalytic domain-containing protein n=1 Tax=Stachybotrys chartarum (strain CBS 109288 / IBT 7711) TaxID=1280523 RepID=A0A084B3W6_STACB|nr:hypothetical protein S7711_00244 [Stachybotrys chartarum IBT 7711]KFA52169.1 hypothetical protein S40293_00640 [Stachybotrys chartarum IBT 40293]
MAQKPGSRQPRLYVVSFDGTWAGGVLNSRRTVVSEFVKLISDHENVFEVQVNGVGSDISILDRIFGGLGGWGTLRNVISAFKNISKQYRPGDKFILIGYSRGAWAARYLAMLIDNVGLPKDGDEDFYIQMYRACDKELIPDQQKWTVPLQDYERWTDVKIGALCCFDTVGSLGLPLTGLAKPLAIIRRAQKKSDIVSDIATNVEFAFHCLSLHETRAPFRATLMRGSNVTQVLFPGHHGHLGWIEDKEGLVHAPFAWMIQQLHTHLGLSFSEAKLAARFPSYQPPPPTQDDDTSCSIAPLKPDAEEPPTAVKLEPGWCHPRILPFSSPLLAVIGRNKGGPGRASSMMKTDGVKVHVGARLRTVVDDVNAVPGFTLVAPVTGKPYWTHRRKTQTTWPWTREADESPREARRSDKDAPAGRQIQESNSWSRVAQRIEEAEVGPLEARLLGLPQSIVSRTTRLTSPSGSFRA